MRWAVTALIFLTSPVWLPVVAVVILIYATGTAIVDLFMKLHTELWRD